MKRRCIDKEMAFMANEICRIQEGGWGGGGGGGKIGETLCVERLPNEGCNNHSTISKISFLSSSTIASGSFFI